MYVHFFGQETVLLPPVGELTLFESDFQFFDNYWLRTFGLGSHSLANDSLKIIVASEEPKRWNRHESDIVVSQSLGYDSNGYAVTPRINSQNGVFSFGLKDFLIPADGGRLTGQYLVLMNDTLSTNELIGWWSLASPFIIPDGKCLQVAFYEFIFKVG